MDPLHVTVFSDMVGKVIEKILGAQTESDDMTFESVDGWRFRFHHESSCCEHVMIEDITGDVADLIGSPLVTAEEVMQEDSAYPKCDSESFTWTFYRFATVKGTVTVRWLGTSNGYYSEDVAFEQTKPPKGFVPTPTGGTAEDLDKLGEELERMRFS